MENNNSEALDIFLAESKEQLSSLQELLLDTEDNHNFSFARIAELFRLVHTLKGSAAMMGYTALAEVTHKYENVLSLLRDKAEKNISIDEKKMKEVTTLGLDFADLYLNASTDPGKYEAGGEFSALEGSLATLGQSMGQKAEEQPAKAQTDAYPPELWLYERVRIMLNHCGMAYLRAFMFQQAIAQLCAKTYTMPSNIGTRAELQQQILEKGFELGYIRKKGIADHEVLDILKRQPMYKSITSLVSTGSGHTSGKTTSAKMLSVKADNVTNLLGLVTEALSLQALLEQYLHRRDINDTYIEHTFKKIQWCTQGIQMGLNDMGLLELGQVFLPTKRLIRKLLSETGKQAEAVFSGGTVMVDKGVLTALNEALLHLIRNAVDHGIEEPEERKKAGKPVKGIIKVSAYEEKERLILTVEDDGYGIDRAKVLRKAKERGLLTKQEDKYTQKEIYGFILQSGFSTKEKVTKNSGRGVSLDVVHEALKKIGGFMEINSQEGKGSRITLNLPVSLSVIKALRVQISNKEVFVPSSVISQVVALNGTQTFTGDGTVQIADRNYSILGKLGDAEYLILLQSGAAGYCLPCQELKTYETVFVKPLPKVMKALLQGNNIYLGCIIDSLGKVRCILDVNLLIQKVKARGGQYETVS
ncbi:MAG: Hpt domain-containing protein [Acidaminococcaceae bacterium]|jgi:two-component system chemotaxis sensor kinase CheA|nr:Hpt domain-containing protein [Acidaminococcaceae bacterium]